MKGNPLASDPKVWQREIGHQFPMWRPRREIPKWKKTDLMAPYSHPHNFSPRISAFLSLGGHGKLSIKSEVITIGGIAIRKELLPLMKSKSPLFLTTQSVTGKNWHTQCHVYSSATQVKLVPHHCTALGSDFFFHHVGPQKKSQAW